MSAIENIPIEPLIRRIVSDEYTNQDLLDFLSLSEKIAVGYLRFLQEARRKNLFLSTEGQDSLHQLAIDCVAPLFRRDDANRFVTFRHYFSPFLDKENPPSNLELFIQLKRLIIRSVKQELARIFRERDPEGAKILRNLRNAIRQSEDLLCVENLAHTYIFSEVNVGDVGIFRKIAAGEMTIHHEEARKALRRDFPLMPIPDLTENYLARFSPFTTYPKLVRQLLQVVRENTQYANYLLLEDVIYVSRSFKDKRIPLWDSLGASEAGNPEAAYYERQLREIVESMADRVEALVTTRYGVRGKFSPEVLHSLQKALNDYVEDFIHKRKTPSYFNLLKRYLPNLTRDVYRRDFRHAFEYLARAVRKEISEEIVKIL